MRSFRSFLWPGAVLALLLIVAITLRNYNRSAHGIPTPSTATGPASLTAPAPDITQAALEPLTAEPPVAATPTAAPLTAESPTVEAPAEPAPTAVPNAAPASQPSPPRVPGHMYYVNSVTGSDHNSGSSPDAAWRSLGPVNARSFVPGDVINLARGSSWTGSGGNSAALVLNGSGAPDQPITLQAYGTGPAPVLSNQDADAYSRILVVRSPYTFVQGLLLRDAHEIGLLISQGADNSKVENVEVTGTGVGITVDAQWALIVDNYVHDLHMVLDEQGNDFSYGAQCILVQGPNNEISYNHLINCSAPSQEYGTDGSAVEFFGNVDNTLVHHNYSFNTPTFSEIGGGSARNVVVSHNIMVQSGQVAIIHLKGRFATTVDNFQFVNNTVYDASDSGAISLFYIDGQTSDSTDFVVRNNIFAVKNYKMAMQGDSPFTHDHNLYYLMNATMNLNYPLGTGEHLGDPLFVDPQTGDFRLKASSPGLGAGTIARISTDTAPVAPVIAMTRNLGADQQ